MNKPKDKLDLLRERYEKLGKNGDLSEAARRAKVANPQSSTALARKCWDDLKPAERKCMVSLIKILNTREVEEKEAEELLGIESNV